MKNRRGFLFFCLSLLLLLPMGCSPAMDVRGRWGYDDGGAHVLILEFYEDEEFLYYAEGYEEATVDGIYRIRGNRIHFTLKNHEGTAKIEKIDENRFYLIDQKNVKREFTRRET